MGETVIVIDTNQIRDSPMLRSATWTELFSKADDWDLRFVVPEVCVREAVSVVRRKWAKDRDVVAKLHIGEFGLDRLQQEMIDVITSTMDGYEDALRTRLGDLGAEIVEPPATLDMLDVVQRAIDRRAPYPVGDGTKDALRDTLIWCTTMEVAAADGGDREVWLVSDNYKDFGDGSTKDVEACPYPLHEHLVEDLAALGIAGRVRYVRTIGRLAQRLASTYAALPSGKQQALLARVERGGFLVRIEAELLQVVLSPRAAALPVRTAMATIQSLSADPEDLTFMDAAMRGAGAWTAQFSQTIEAQIDLTDAEGNTSELTKPLNVAGRLVGSADGSVTELTVTSIEALPDDSMRRAWKRPTTDLVGQINAGDDFLGRRIGKISADDDIFGKIGRISPDTDFLGKIGRISPDTDFLGKIGRINPDTDFLGKMGADNEDPEGDADSGAGTSESDE